MSMHSAAIEIESLWKLFHLQRHGAAPTPEAAPAAGTETADDAAVREGRAFWALRDINLTVRRGEAVGIIGRNGAGKSTLLKVLSRVTAPTRGRARIHGSVVSLLEVGSGFHDELTGAENIELNAAILGMSKSDLDKRFDDIVKFSGIGDFIDMPVKHLSSGMRVRLGFSIAVHVEPEILIVDEVLAVGDAEFQQKCQQRVAEIVGAKDRTVLVVSHSMGEITRLCSRVVMLQQGQIVAEGAPDDTVQRYLDQVQGAASIDHLSVRIKSQDKEDQKVIAAEQGTPSNGTKAKPVGQASSASPDSDTGKIRPIIDENDVWHLAERTDHAGDGRLRFTKVKLLDESGTIIKSVGAGKGATFEVEYSAEHEVVGDRRCSLSVAISNNRDSRVFWLPSGIVAGDSVSLKPSGRFIWNVREVPLLPGTYFVDLWCLIDGVLADQIRHAAVLVVEPSDFYPTGRFHKPTNGDVIVRFQWRGE